MQSVPLINLTNIITPPVTKFPSPLSPRPWGGQTYAAKKWVSGPGILPVEPFGRISVGTSGSLCHHAWLLSHSYNACSRRTRAKPPRLPTRTSGFGLFLFHLSPLCSLAAVACDAVFPHNCSATHFEQDYVALHK